MLIMAKVDLELISDAEMYLFFEKGMGGGVSYIFKRYSKTNNNCLKFYDQNKNQNILYASTQIIYMVMLCLNFFQ